MNQIIINNAVLHLAKSFLASMLGTFMSWIFFICIIGKHYLLGFITFISFSIMIVISIAQMALFIKKIIRANRK